MADLAAPPSNLSSLFYSIPKELFEKAIQLVALQFNKKHTEALRKFFQEYEYYPVVFNKIIAQPAIVANFSCLTSTPDAYLDLHTCLSLGDN